MKIVIKTVIMAFVIYMTLIANAVLIFPLSQKETHEAKLNTHVQTQTYVTVEESIFKSVMKK